MKVLRKRSLQRVLTAILSIAMIFTSLPVNMLSGVFGVPGKVKAASSVLDADQLDVTADEITSDTKYGDFTIMANGTKKSAIKTISSLGTGYTQNPDKAFTNTVRLTGGGLGVNADHVVNGIKFTAEANSTVTVYAALKAGSTNTSRYVKVCKAVAGDTKLGDEVAKSAEGCTSTITKYELKIEEAGDYYIGMSGDGCIIPYLEVSSTGTNSDVVVNKIVLNADEYDTTAEEITSDTKYGDFTIMANGTKKSAIKTISSLGTGYTQNPDKTFTNTVRLTGGGLGVNADHVVNGIKFTAEADSTVTVYAALKAGSTNTSRYVKVCKAVAGDTKLGDEVAKSAEGCTSAITKYELKIEEAGDYYIGMSGDGCIIPYLEVSSISASSSTIVNESILNADEYDTTAEEITADTKYGDFTIMANGTKKSAIKTISSLGTGYTQNPDKTFTNTVRLTGGGLGVNADHVVNGIKFTAEADSTVTVYAALKAGSTNTSRYVKVCKAVAGDTKLGDEVAKSAEGCTSTITKYELKIEEAGDYYIGMSGDGCIIPYLAVTSVSTVGGSVKIGVDVSINNIETSELEEDTEDTIVFTAGKNKVGERKKGEASINLISGTEYTLSVKGKESEYKAYKAGDANKSSKWTAPSKAQTVKFVVEKRNLAPKATFTFTDADRALLADDGAVIVKDPDGKVLATYTKASSNSNVVTLENMYGKKCTLEVKDPSTDELNVKIGNLAATSDFTVSANKMAFTVGEVDTMIPVTLTSKFVSTTIDFDAGASGLVLDGVNSNITLSLTTGTKDPVYVKNGDTVRLYKGETYGVAVKEGEKNQYGADYSVYIVANTTSFKAAAGAQTIVLGKGEVVEGEIVRPDISKAFSATSFPAEVPMLDKDGKETGFYMVLLDAKYGVTSIRDDDGLLKLTKAYVNVDKKAISDKDTELPGAGVLVKFVPRDNGKLYVKADFSKPATDGAYLFTVDNANNTVISVENKGQLSKSDANPWVINVKKENTYYICGKGTDPVLKDIYAAYITLTDWSEVPAPVIDSVKTTSDGSVSVDFTARVGGSNADSVSVNAYSKTDSETVAYTGMSVASTSFVDGYKSYMNLDIDKSGYYSYKAFLNREGETPKESEATDYILYILPMEKPAGVNFDALGLDENGVTAGVRLSWNAFSEATSYNIYTRAAGSTDEGTLAASTENAFYELNGLTVNKEIEIGIQTVRDSEYVNDKSEITWVSVTPSKDAVKSWHVIVYGESTNDPSEAKSWDETVNGVDKLLVGMEGKSENGEPLSVVRAYDVNGKKVGGKLRPASTDGVTFMYATIDPKKENFTLEADITVTGFKYSNGQEGFGLMAADRIPSEYTGANYWNNSYKAGALRLDYSFDVEENEVTTQGTAENPNSWRYNMYPGLGAEEKRGITKNNLKGVENGTVAVNSVFSSVTETLDVTPGLLKAPAGKYTVVKEDNITDANPGIVPKYERFHVYIRRHNSGYTMSMVPLDENGNMILNNGDWDPTNPDDKYSKTFYTPASGDPLTALDSDNIYVGFMASRNAEFAIDSYKLTLVSPKNDTAVPKKLTKVKTSVVMASSEVSSTAGYKLELKPNAAGTLTVSRNGITVVRDIAVKQDERKGINMTLSKGENEITYIFTPTNPMPLADDPMQIDNNYEPVEGETILKDYSPISNTVKVTYQNGLKTTTYKNGKTKYTKVVYVSPSANDATADGTKANPYSLQYALNFAKPGNNIFLTATKDQYEYLAEKDLGFTVFEGTDGTAASRITLMPDPEAEVKPVLAANTTAELGKRNNVVITLTIAGDYWTVKGFDVTRSGEGKDGMLLAGDYNIVEDMNFYRNGNTGLQISRFKSTSTWPKNNLVKNCTSYLNSDEGAEDADGFAAKLTCGEGNVFDGCIAAYNADDGWDLYAKVETGSIGTVTIMNSMAFKNGYYIDLDGVEREAGNGNGFKMGGESLPGKHKLVNSIAFDNKSKGFDSNSCPDIQLTDGTSYNNGQNLGVYTKDASETNYAINGIISMLSTIEGTNGKDKVDLLGEQAKHPETVFGPTYYRWDNEKSLNSLGEEATKDWFVNTDDVAAAQGFIYDHKDVFVNVAVDEKYKDTGIERLEGGTINTNGFLALTEAALEKGAGSKLAMTKEDAEAVDAAVLEAKNAKPVEATGIYLAQDKENSRVAKATALVEGQSLYYTAHALPLNANSNNMITWKSSDENVARVSASMSMNTVVKGGKTYQYYEYYLTIKGFAAGKAVITGTLTNGKTKKLNVTVVQDKEALLNGTLSLPVVSDKMVTISNATRLPAEFSVASGINRTVTGVAFGASYKKGGKKVAAAKYFNLNDNGDGTYTVSLIKNSVDAARDKRGNLKYGLTDRYGYASAGRYSGTLDVTAIDSDGTTYVYSYPFAINVKSNETQKVALELIQKANVNKKFIARDASGNLVPQYARYFVTAEKEIESIEVISATAPAEIRKIASKKQLNALKSDYFTYGDFDAESGELKLLFAENGRLNKKVDKRVTLTITFTDGSIASKKLTVAVNNSDPYKYKADSITFYTDASLNANGEASENVIFRVAGGKAEIDPSAIVKEQLAFNAGDKNNAKFIAAGGRVEIADGRVTVYASQNMINQKKNFTIKLTNTVPGVTKAYTYAVKVGAAGTSLEAESAKTKLSLKGSINILARGTGYAKVKVKAPKGKSVQTVVIDASGNATDKWGQKISDIFEIAYADNMGDGSFVIKAKKGAEMYVTSKTSTYSVPVKLVFSDGIAKETTLAVKTVAKHSKGQLNVKSAVLAFGSGSSQKIAMTLKGNEPVGVALSEASINAMAKRGSINAVVVKANANYGISQDLLASDLLDWDKDTQTLTVKSYADVLKSGKISEACSANVLYKRLPKAVTLNFENYFEGNTSAEKMDAEQLKLQKPATAKLSVKLK